MRSSRPRPVRRRASGLRPGVADGRGGRPAQVPIAPASRSRRASAAIPAGSASARDAGRRPRASNATAQHAPARAIRPAACSTIRTSICIAFVLEAWRLALRDRESHDACLPLSDPSPPIAAVSARPRLLTSRSASTPSGRRQASTLSERDRSENFNFPATGNRRTRAGRMRSLHKTLFGLSFAGGRGRRGRSDRLPSEPSEIARITAASLQTVRPVA